MYGIAMKTRRCRRDGTLTGREPFLVFDGIVRAVVDQELSHLAARVEGHREVKRGVPGGVGVIHVRAAPHQKLDDGHLAAPPENAAKGREEDQANGRTTRACDTRVHINQQ